VVEKVKPANWISQKLRFKHALWQALCS